MSALRRAIAGWEAISFAPIPRSVIRPVGRETREESPDQVERMRAELRAAHELDDPGSLSRRALSFGLASPGDDAVAGMFLQLVLEARRRNDAPSARAVLRAYLGGFEPDGSETARLAEALSGLRGKLSRPRAQLVERFRLGEPREAIRAIGAALRDEGGAADRTLLEASRPSILSSPLGLRAVAAALVDAASEPGVETYERLLVVMRGPDGKLTPLAKRHAYAALVRPFAHGTEPPPPVKKLVQSVIVAEYGDPRLPRTPVPSLADDPDRAVAHECIAVLKRWLAIDTFELFIDVISQTAVDRMWKQRRDFWMRYFDIGAVSDVHVVFGNDAASVARGIRARNGQKLSAGNLKGASSNQSVLIMKIADMTVVEWSHNGRMGFWRADNRSAPTLYCHEYQSFAVKAANGSDRSLVHDHSGNWRGRAYRIIHEETGVRA